MTDEKKAGQEVAPMLTVVDDWFEVVPPGWPRPEKAPHRTRGGKGEVGRLVPQKKRKR
jgi:hypothetical protein